MPPKRKHAAEESASDDAPIGGHNNGCYRSQQVLFDDLITPHATYTAQTSHTVPTPSTEEKSTRLRSQEMKLDVLRQYTAWVAAGRPYGQLQQQLSCTSTIVRIATLRDCTIECLNAGRSRTENLLAAHLSTTKTSGKKCVKLWMNLKQNICEQPRTLKYKLNSMLKAMNRYPAKRPYGRQRRSPALWPRRKLRNHSWM